MICAPKFTTRIDVREAIGRVSLIGELDPATVPVLDDHVHAVSSAVVPSAGRRADQLLRLVNVGDLLVLPCRREVDLGRSIQQWDIG